MPDLYAMAAQFREELLRGDREAAGRMAAAYAEAQERILAAVNDLLARARSAREAGEQTGPGWLLARGRLEQILEQVRAELARWERTAAGEVAEVQRAAAVQGIQDSAAMAGPVVRGSFQTLPREALEDLAGFLGDGTPVAAALQARGVRTAAQIRSLLIGAVAVGENPRRAASRIRRAAGMELVDALRIARTETMRAWRESSRRTYEANADVIRRWQWVAARSARTCAACLAMDGREFPLSEPMGTHPNCRCVMVPVAGAGPPPRASAEEWLRGQPEAVQVRVLGRAKRDAWLSSVFTLSDLVGFRQDPVWGPVRWEKSLKAVLGGS